MILLVGRRVELIRTVLLIRRASLSVRIQNRNGTESCLLLITAAHRYHDKDGDGDDDDSNNDNNDFYND